MIPGVTFHSRGEWQSASQPVTGPPMDFTQLDTFAVHYTASPNVPDGDDPHAVAALLRAIQRDYVTNRGYSIGYNYAVDQHGGVWQLRGVGMRCAANRGWNHRTVAVLCLVDGADPLTAVALEAVRKVLSFVNKASGKTLTVRPHSEIGATACPGDGVRAQIPLITPWVEPTPPPTPDPEEDDMKLAIRWKHPDNPAQFLIGVGNITRITKGMVEQWRKDGVLPELVTEADDTLLAECLRETVGVDNDPDES